MYQLREVKIITLKIDTKSLAVVLATLAVVTPLFVSYPFLLTRNFTPQVAQIEAVCARIPKDAVVLWFGSASSFLVEPSHTVCGVPAYGVKSLDMDQLPEALKRFISVGTANRKHVIVGTSDNSDLVRFTPELTPISTITWSDVEQTYKRFPRSITHVTQTVLLGELHKDGSLSQLN